MSLKKIREGLAEVYVYTGEKISKELPVFYNPEMKLNRDITILLLRQFPPLNLCDPLSGSGIRAIRFAKELKFKSIVASDINKKAINLIKKNMQYNNVKFKVKNQDASIMLLQSKGFDFIDLDVFGSPNFVLDAAIKRLSRNGILAVTATDTACLSGTFPKTCIRKYWAKPVKNEIMHETGLRILIRKIQLVGAQYDKALVPIFSYAQQHYMRVFLKCLKGKKQVDDLLNRHEMFQDAGPLWLGALWDKVLVNKMYKADANNTLIRVIRDESKIKVIGFYHIPKIVKQNKIKSIPRKETILKVLRKQGFKASETHLSPEGIRSNIPINRLLQILRKLTQ